MHIRHILSALSRHRIATVLITLEIAVACAVLCNAGFLIASRIGNMHIVSGIDEASLAVVTVDGYDSSKGKDVSARIIEGLRGIAGIKSVNAIDTVPFGQQVDTAGVTKDRDGKIKGGVVDFYLGDPGTIEALGLKLVAGAWPQRSDYVAVNSYFAADNPTVVTRALAEHMWPGENPLGKEFWCGQFHFHVIGVLEHLAIAQPGGRGMNSVEWSAFIPALPGNFFSGGYLLRADPADIGRVLRDAAEVVAKVAPDVVFDHDNSKTVTDLRHDFFARDRAMAGMLLGVITLLLLVTSLGIVGLTSFWVGQRRRQIGIRRAIGATRADILHYFQTENFLIVGMGVILGVLLAYLLNIVLMEKYEVTHLPATYLLVSAVVLWALGQLAVLGPALRAASVPPVVATQSV
jgi:putative ABC transport system permease protein